MSFADIPNEVLFPNIIAHLFGSDDEIDVVNFAATHSLGLAECKMKTADSARHAVDCVLSDKQVDSEDYVQYDAKPDDFKRNLRIVNALHRRAVHLDEHGMHGPKRERFDEEIINAAEGVNLADLDYVKEHEEEEEEKEEEMRRLWIAAFRRMHQS